MARRTVKRSTVRKSKTQFDLIQASAEGMHVMINGMRYEYVFAPPDILLCTKITAMFKRSPGRAFNLLKKRASLVRTEIPASSIHVGTDEFHNPYHGYALRIGGTQTGRFTRGPIHPSAIVPDEIKNNPNISMTVTLPADIGQEFLDRLDKTGGNIHDFMRLRVRGWIRNNKSYKAGDEVSFGKYIGERIDTVVQNDPGYILFCQERVRGFELDDELQAMLSSIIESAEGSLS